MDGAQNGDKARLGYTWILSQPPTISMLPHTPPHPQPKRHCGAAKGRKQKQSFPCVPPSTVSKANLHPTRRAEWMPLLSCPFCR